MQFYRLLNKGITLAIAALLSQGCSNHFVQAVAPTTYSVDETASFFPLEQGYQSTYQVGSNFGSSNVVSYTVGKDVSLLGETATLWIAYNNGHKDTSYFVRNENSLIFYEGKQSEPEIILDFPLTLGKTWSRFYVPGTQIDDSTDSGGGTIDKDSTLDDNGVGLASNFPIEGMAQMTVDKIESVELSDGNYYSGVIRVSNDAGGNTRNYYWYASGIGLIKYILGGVNPQNPSGGIQAELISHGYAF